MPHYIDTMAYEKATGAPWHAAETEADGRTVAVDGVMDGLAMLRASRTDWTVSLHPVSVLMDPRPRLVEAIPGVTEVYEDWTPVLESPDAEFGRWLLGWHQRFTRIVDADPNESPLPVSFANAFALDVETRLEALGASELVKSEAHDLLGSGEVLDHITDEQVLRFLTTWLAEARLPRDYVEEGGDVLTTAVTGLEGAVREPRMWESHSGWADDWNHVMAFLRWNMRKRTKFDEVTAPEFNAVVRDDNRALLAVVGSKFRPVQQLDVIGFLEAVVGQGLEYETGGLAHGRAEGLVPGPLPRGHARRRP